MTPPVTILLPTLNERAFVHDCLETLSGQDYPCIDEILVVDGGSTDGTRDIVERFGGVVRLVDNPKVTAAAAMNAGIAAARNEVIVRADAHTIYASDYVTASVASLEKPVPPSSAVRCVPSVSPRSGERSRRSRRRHSASGLVGSTTAMSSKMSTRCTSEHSVGRPSSMPADTTTRTSSGPPKIKS